MGLNNCFINSTIMCNERKDVDLDSLNLLASGMVTNLCRCSYKNENKHHFFIYDTDDFVSLSRLQTDLSFEDAIDILSSAANMMRILQLNNLVLDNIKNAREYIFKTNGEYRFIYVPLVRKSNISIRNFLIKLISVVHHKDVRLTEFVRGLHKKKEDEQAITFLNDFVSSYGRRNSYSQSVTSLLSDEGATSLLGDEGATSLLSDEGATSLLSDEGATSLLGANIRGLVNNSPPFSDDGETTVLSRSNCSGEYDTVKTVASFVPLSEVYTDSTGEYETTVLTSQSTIRQQPVNREIESEYCLYLIRNLNGEKINIDVTPFNIGKDRTNMNFVLNNDSVSRHHATILYESGGYFIMDNNSTNGTTIEGIRLQTGEKGEIENSYIISLGNESFQAHIERRNK